MRNLKSAWKAFTSVVDHSFFYNTKDPLAAAMKEHIQDFRGLPFPGDPTTEMIATLFLCKARKMLEPYRKQVAVEAVCIEETPVNSVEISTNSAIFTATEKHLDKYNAWWNDADPTVRNFSETSDQLEP